MARFNYSPVVSPPDGAPVETPFVLSDRNSWVGNYSVIPQGHNLSLPIESLPAFSDAFKNKLATSKYKTVGDYVTDAENWERTQTGKDLAPSPIDFVSNPNVSQVTPEVAETHYYTDPYTGKVVTDVNPTTGEAIPRAIPGNTYTNQQYASFLERQANSPEQIARRQAISNKQLANKNLLESMTEAQKQEARTLNITPSQYLQMKGAAKFAEGGDLDNPGQAAPSPLMAYETNYGDLPPEVAKYMNMPGANPDKVLQWFNLGITEPQTFNQARLLAEAVGYSPEQAKVVAGQWQMESSGGSRLSSPYNYFGIKSHNEAVRNRLEERGIDVSAGKEAATTEGKGQKIKSSFMEFNNAFEGFAAHKAFLETNQRYQKALASATAKDFAVGLQKAGYATAENYGVRLYNDYVKPKELNPKSGDIRPKSLGETKSEKIKPFAVSQAPSTEVVNKMPLLAPQRLDVETPVSLDPTIAPGMYGSTPYQQKVEQEEAINMSAKPTWFGSGQSNFKNGGTMNFKSAGDYHKWLGYVHATGLAESTPGHQKVSIGGESHKVEHAMGGHMYGQGGFNNPGFRALPPAIQNKIKSRSFASGGEMGNPLTEFNAGGSHEENPLGGIPQGVAPDGKVNLVEQGETKLDSANYIFSDNLKVSKQVAEDFNLPKKVIGKTFAAASKALDLPNSRRENDTIETNYKTKALDSLMNAQEVFKQEQMAEDMAAMFEKYPEQMSAMMQAQGAPAPGGQMQEMMPGQEAAMGMNPMGEVPTQGMAQPEPVPTSQLPMSYGGSMYACGGKMYADGGWFDEHSGAVSGAASGIMSGAAAGAALGVPGMIGGALIGATIGGFKGNKQDQTEQQAIQNAQNAQNLQSAANPNAGVAQSGVPVMPINNTAMNMPAAQSNANYPSYNINAYGDTSASGDMMRNGGTVPSYHTYPQINPMWRNNAGPMGQGLTNTQIYADGGELGDPPTSVDYYNTVPKINNLGISDKMRITDEGAYPIYDKNNKPFIVEKSSKSVMGSPYSDDYYRFKTYQADSKGRLRSNTQESYLTRNIGGDKVYSHPDRYVTMDTLGYSQGRQSFPVRVVEKNIADGFGGSYAVNEFDATREQVPSLIRSMKNQTSQTNAEKVKANADAVYKNALKVEANRRKVLKLAPLTDYEKQQILAGKEFAYGGSFEMPRQQMYMPLDNVERMGGHIYDGESETSGFMLNDYSTLKNPWLNDQSYLGLNVPKVSYTNNNNSKISTTDAGHYNIDSTLQNIDQDLSVQGTLPNTLANLAPMAYNFYQGIKKPKTYAARDFYTPVEAFMPDYREAINEAKNTYAQVSKGLQQTGESGGVRAANLANAAFERNKAMSQIQMEAANQGAAENRRVNAANAMARTEAMKNALQSNWAIKAAQQEHIKEGLTGAQDWQNTQLANDLAMKYAIIGAPDISKHIKTGYTPYGRYIKEILSNKTKKD